MPAQVQLLRHRVRVRSMLAIVAPVLGCYGPNPAYFGVGVGESESTTTGTDDAESTSSTETESSTTDTDTTETETDTDTDTSDTEPVDPTCGDGIVDPGEFCFTFSALLGAHDVQSLAAGDFDADGDIDLAIGRKDDVLVLFGDGAGGFPLQADLPEDNGNYFGAAVGDLDGDRIADLAVTNFDADVLAVYVSLGNGDFAPPLTFATGDQPQRLRLAAIDDGPPLDALITLKGNDAVAVLLGDGAGGFGAATNFTTNGNDPLDLNLAILDPNLSLDLAVANFGADQIAVLQATAPGSFAAPMPYPVSGKPRSVELADFDGDGVLDVAAVLEDVDLVEFLHGDGVGGLVGPTIAVSIGAKPVAALAQDLDNDGAIDLLSLNLDDHSVGVLFNDPDSPGDFLPYQTLVWFDGFQKLAAVVSADFNGDSVMDVVVGGDGVRAMLSDP